MMSIYSKLQSKQLKRKLNDKRTNQQMDARNAMVRIRW